MSKAKRSTADAALLRQLRRDFGDIDREAINTAFRLLKAARKAKRTGKTVHVKTRKNP